MTPPTTPSGKRLLAVMSTVPPEGRKGLAYFVNAIEAEAREQERARIRAAVEALPGTDPFARALGLSSVAREVVSRAAVRAAIDRSEP